MLQNNSVNEVNKYGISINISDYEVTQSGFNKNILYKIDLYSIITNKKWSVIHNYNEFSDLNFIFNKYYYNPPNFINEEYFSINAGLPTEYSQRKEMLNEYINKVIERIDLLTSCYCIQFFNLNNYDNNINDYIPKELNNFKNQLVLPISVSYFLKECNLLFLGCGKQYKTILENIVDKLKDFNLFANDYTFINKESTKVKGQLVILNVIKNYKGNYLIEPLYGNPLYSECSSINFYKEKNCLILGMYNGTVNLYKILINEKSKGNKIVIEAGNFKSHLNKQIINVIINFDFNLIYVFAKDCFVKIFQLNNFNKIKEIPIAIKNICNVYFDGNISYKNKNLIIIGDESGRIYILDIFQDMKNPIVLKTYSNFMKKYITKIYISNDKHNMLIANKGGFVNFYHLNNFNYNNKDNFNITFISYFKLTSNIDITDIILTDSKILILSLDNGFIYIYANHFYDFPQIVINAHKYTVGSIYYDENKNIILSTSEDKDIKIYKLPDLFPEQYIKNDINKIYNINNSNNNNFENLENDEIENEEKGIKKISEKNKENEYFNLKINEIYDVNGERLYFSDDLDGWSIH